MALNNSRFQHSEYARNIWVITPEIGTPFESLRDPAYWAHVAAKLRPWDIIEVRAEDGAYWAQLLVQDCAARWAKVAVLQKVELHAEAPKVEESEDHIVEFAGPHHKWRVVRKADKETLKFGMTKPEAMAWLADHLRVVA